MQTEISTEHPYTQQQWQVLDTERQTAIKAVAEYLSSEKLTDQPTSEILSETLNLLRPSQGCVPEEEADDELVKSIRKKFAAVYWTGLQLANEELQRQGRRAGQDFNLSLVIDSDNEDFTVVVVVDEDLGNCYIYEGHKAWHFHFATLADLADAVLSVRNVLVRKVSDSLATQQQVYVVVEGGLVQEVVALPPHIRLTVIDHDVEETCGDGLEKSPLNQQPCYLTHY